MSDPTSWQRVRVAGWYGGGKQFPIRWVPVRDGQDAFEPQGFPCTDRHAEPLAVLR